MSDTHFEFTIAKLDQVAPLLKSQDLVGLHVEIGVFLCTVNPQFSSLQATVLLPPPGNLPTFPFIGNTQPTTICETLQVKCNVNVHTDKVRFESYIDCMEITTTTVCTEK